MGTQTKIEWADSTWSPWRGCAKVSPGCANCYAEALAARNPGVLGGWGKGAPRVLAKNWDEPVGWNRKSTQRFTEWSNRWDGTIRSMFKPQSVPPSPARPRVFPSLCDWLDDEVPVEWLGRFLRLIHETQHLDWLLLTKRPENWGKRLRAAHCATTGPVRIAIAEWLDCNPPVNVWLGVSVEDQKRAEERIPLLLETPARLRWLSVEPLLGEIGLRPKWLADECNACGRPMPRNIEGCWNPHTGDDDCDGSRTVLRKVDWVVVGGESGPKARECHADWIRSLVRQCQSAEVPVFVKQVGSRPIDRSVRAAEWGVVKDPKGGDPNEWPMDLCVRQFPER